MVTLDDRTGNVLTTILVFVAALAAAFAARSTIVVFVLALFLAYLLEPLVAAVEAHLPSRMRSRIAAITVVYLALTGVVAGTGFAFAPSIGEQIARFETEFPVWVQQLTERGIIAKYSGQIMAVVQRLGSAVGTAATNTGWLLLVPLVAIFFLKNRAELLDKSVKLLARRRDRASVKRTVDLVDRVLADYARSQLLLIAMSTVIYSASMALLGFPYPIALGLLAGPLEIIPIVGWVLSAVLILAVGWISHANWIWMAAIILVWKTLEGVWVSPRIMGTRLQLEPIVVILALMVGGQIGGVLGVVLSVPLVAVVHIVWLDRTSSQNAAVA
jgi:predicted PurR-regulated permease PerM